MRKRWLRILQCRALILLVKEAAARQWKFDRLRGLVRGYRHAGRIFADSNEGFETCFERCQNNVLTRP